MDVKERRINWIKKLKSDKYQQGDGSLLSVFGDEMCYCCIGVYLDGDVTWKPSDVMMTDNRDELYRQFRRETEISLDMQTHLISMNDERGRDFKFIARFLEVVWGL
jgi:hypothetical protein